MPRKAEDVDVHALHIDGQRARRLRGVYDEQQSIGPRNATHRRNIHGIARQVGGMGADNGPGILPDEPRKIRRIHPALPVRRNKAERQSLLRLPAVQGAQDGIVLKIGGHHMRAGGNRAMNGNVERLRGVGRKDHAVGPPAAEQGSQLFSRAIDRPRRRKAPRMRAPRAVAHGLQGRYDRVDHLLRLVQRRCRIVEIDHEKVASFPVVGCFMVPGKGWRFVRRE